MFSARIFLVCIGLAKKFIQHCYGNETQTNLKAENPINKFICHFYFYILQTNAIMWCYLSHYFTYYDNLWAHLCCCKWHYFFLFFSLKFWVEGKRCFHNFVIFCDTSIRESSHRHTHVPSLPTSLPPPSAPYPFPACHRGPVCIPEWNSHWLSIFTYGNYSKAMWVVLSKRKGGETLQKISLLYSVYTLFYKSLSDLFYLITLKIISSCNSNPGHIPENATSKKRYVTWIFHSFY